MMGNQLKTCRFFLAVITDNFLAKSKTYLEYCEDVSQRNIPMYLIIKEDVNWEKNREIITHIIQNFPWRTPAGCQFPIQYFSTDEELDKALRIVKDDIRWLEMINSS